MEPLETIALSPQEIGKLLSAGSPDATLVYIYMKATGDYQLKQVNKSLNLPENVISWAKTMLNQLGLLDDQKPKVRFSADKAPHYTEDAITAFTAQDPSFRLLQGEICRRLGRVLSSEELDVLLAIRDYLKLPPEVVSLAFTYCSQRMEVYNRAHGTNHSVTMRNLERVCYDWANKGIVTMDQASAHISQMLQRMTPESQVKKLLKLDRPLVRAEQEYISSWLDMGFAPDAIGIAFEKTVLNKGKLVWPYMHKILQNWHEKGLHTADQIQQEPQGKKTEQEPNGYTSGGYTFGESDLNAIANLQRLRDSIKEQ
jgi:DnaD/phage-associated family protein